MKFIVNYIIVTLLSISFLHAQEDVRLRLDSTEFLIGDQTELNISYTGKRNPKDFNVLQEAIDTLSQVDLLGAGPLIRKQEGDINYIEQRFKVAFFDTGTIWIPAIPVVLEFDSGLDTLETNEIPVKVFSPQQDSLAMAPIKEIIREPWNITDAWPYFLAILIAVMLYFSLKRRKRKRTEITQQQEQEEIIKTPYELAMEAIEGLSEFEAGDPIQLKEHFASLSIILRTYLEGQFDFPAAESTTYEIGIDMKKAGISEEIIEESSQLLNKVDLIKFAKIQPSQEDIVAIKPDVISSIQKLYKWALASQAPEEEESINQNK